MELDYYESTRKFTLTVPREDGVDVHVLMKEHGLNYSTSASTVNRACLFTDNKFAAMTYAKHATPRAIAQFGHHMPELEASRLLASDTKYPIGPGALRKGFDLYPFQKAGVDYILRRTNSLIGDSPGLGKTNMAIVMANEMQAKSVLVICPASIRLQWQKQIHDWSTMPGRFISYPILKTTDGVHPNAQWTIVSYDLLRSKPIWHALNDRLFDLIVIDEAHYLKTSSSGRTKAVFGSSDLDGLSNRAGSILGLTGTPLPNRPRECFTIAKGLCWDAIDFMSENAFKERFNPVKTGVTVDRQGNERRWSQEKSGRLFELQNRLRSNFMIRRLKRDVLPQLPPIQYDMVEIEENGEINKLLEAEKVLDIDPDTLKAQNIETLGHISTVRMQMGIACAPAVADYATMIMDGGEEKLVIFAWHIEVMNILEERLKKFGVVRIDGNTSVRRRQEHVDKFIKDPKTQICLGNLQSIGTGVDGLQQVCRRGLFAECDWVPGNNFEQGVGRLERIGQNFGIFIEFMIVPGSIIAKIMASALDKLKDIHNSLDQEF